MGSHVTGSNGVGVLKEPPVKAMIDNLSFLARTKKALRLTLQVHLTSTIQNTWDTVLKDRKLIVDLPSSTLPDGSKQSFVTLLEYAERSEAYCGFAIKHFT